jgi:hypothetical protein
LNTHGYLKHLLRQHICCGGFCRSLGYFTILAVFGQGFFGVFW